mgnify:FL=1
MWPGGVFITKARKNEENAAGPTLVGNKVVKQDSQKGMEQQSASFESQLEAARCARVVYEALVGELYYLVLFQCFLDPWRSISWVECKT